LLHRRKTNKIVWLNSPSSVRPPSKRPEARTWSVDQDRVHRLRGYWRSTTVGDERMYGAGRCDPTSIRNDQADTGFAHVGGNHRRPARRNRC
jgi:hypothetical protein